MTWAALGKLCHQASIHFQKKSHSYGDRLAASRADTSHSYIEGGNKTQDGVKNTFQLILGSKLIIFNLKIHHNLKFSAELSLDLPFHLLGIQCTFCQAQSLQIFSHFGILHSFFFLKKKKEKKIEQHKTRCVLPSSLTVCFSYSLAQGFLTHVKVHN